MSNSIPATKNPTRRWILWGIPALILLGGPMHFIFELLGKPIWIALFVPVNESVWEHLKLQLWPMAIWWLVGYLLLRKQSNFLAKNWWVAALVAQIANMLVIITFFYTYTGAFGIESLVLDIISMILAVILSQSLALHVYRFGRANRACGIISAVMILLLLALFTVTTYAPPHVPLFHDSPTGQYGIVK